MVKWRGFAVLRDVARRHPKRMTAIVAVWLGIVILQFAYGADRALPLARMGESSVGFKSQQSVATVLADQYSRAPLELSMKQKKTVKTNLAAAGLKPDTEKIMAGLTSYPWWLRLVPGSIVATGALTTQPIVLSEDKQKLQEFIVQTVAACEIKPVDASVAVQGGTVELVSARDGQTCDEKKLRTQLLSQTVHEKGLKLAAETKVVKPARSDSDVQALLANARKIVARPLQLNLAGKSYTLSAQQTAPWLRFPEDPKTKKLTIDIDETAVSNYLSGIEKDIYIAPTPTLITTVDGIEKSRVDGTSGRGVDRAKSFVQIRQALLGQGGAVALATAVIAPPLNYERSYSATPEGLQALLNDLVKDKKDMAISLRKLGDNGVSANGTKQYHPASTYKMYVAWAVLKRIDAGQMGWNDSATNGQTVAQCFDAMIINSDNACGEWLGAKIGWTNLNNALKGLGLTCTNLSSAWLSCANDEALFLQKLESGQLMSEPSRARLIDAMKRQIFRKGIPAGVSAPVADKVGFLDGNLHDAALVYSPKGVYVLVVMSKDGSWADIAEVARKIDAQMNAM
ncbi:MAG: serine hydrolase [Candidatus Saccharimonadales bacterium]